MRTGFRYVLSILLLLTFYLPLAVSSQPLDVRDLAVLVDPDGSQTIASVSAPEAQARFKQLDAVLGAGYTRNVHWLRFTVQTPSAGAWWLEIEPPFLDDLRLYQPDAVSGGFNERRAGDRLPFASREENYRGFVFKLALPDSAPRTFYLRLQTTSSSFLSLQLWRAEQFHAAKNVEYAGLGLLVGFYVLVLLLNLILWLGLRESLYGWFSMFVGANLLLYVSLNGLTAQYLLPQSPLWADASVGAGVLLFLAGTAPFYRRMLHIERDQKIYFNVFRVMVVLPCLLLVTLYTGHFTEAARLAMGYSGLAALLVLYVSFKLWRQGRHESPYLLLGTALTLASGVSAILFLLGLMPGELFAQMLSSQQWTLFLVTLSMQAALAARLRSMHQERRQLIAHASEIERDAAHERRVNAKLARLVDEKSALMDTLEKQQAVLQENEFRWKFALEGSAEGVWDKNFQTGTSSYSPRWKAMLGYTEHERLPAEHEWLNRIHPDDRAEVVRRDQAHLDGQSEIYEAEFRLRCKDDRYKWILSRGMIVSRGPDGTPMRMIGTHADISLRKEAEENLQLAASVFKHAMEAIVITAPDSRIIDVNAAFSRITGYSRAEVLGQNPRLLNSGLQGKDFFQAMWQQLNEHGNWYGEIWNRRKNGEVYAATQHISAVRDAQGKLQHYIALSADITVAKSQQQELERIAHYDPLTKLPNRALLADRMNQAMTQTQRRGRQLAVVFLDLDGFKAVNDGHGHDAGDFLLVSVADRMKFALRDGDTLARIGGDEFVAVLLDLTDIASSAPMLNRLLAAASQPVLFGSVTLQVSASLGVTFFPQAQDIDADQLMRQADQAMYQAKLTGKNRFHFFDAAHDRSVRARHALRDDIGRALIEGEFTLHYQPQVNLRTAQVIGAEALIRWRHPDKGLLEPAHFLPLIKDHPLAIEVGQWVLENALQQVELWQEAGLAMPVSVNIGARHLQQPDFVAQLRQTLAAHPTLAPSCLELELFETSVVGDLEHVAQIIAECRQMGVPFALDGFGWGGSSLSYLKHLQLARLKLDRSIVLHMLEDPDELAILKSILGLARAFDLELLAEGVESAGQSQMLLQLGCELAQGFGIAQPMTGAELPDWIAGWRADSTLR